MVKSITTAGLWTKTCFFLRKRIHEMKRMEMKDEQQRVDWMEWENKYFDNNNYQSDIIEAIGFLQNLVMETTPSLALAIVIFSVPISMASVVLRLMDIVKVILAGA